MRQGLARQGVGQRVSAVRRHDRIRQDLTPLQPVTARRPVGSQVLHVQGVPVPPYAAVGIYQDKTSVVPDQRGRHSAINASRGPRRNPRRPVQRRKALGKKAEPPGTDIGLPICKTSRSARLSRNTSVPSRRCCTVCPGGRRHRGTGHGRRRRCRTEARDRGVHSRQVLRLGSVLELVSHRWPSRRARHSRTLQQ